jgi:hypothetical protein
MNYPPAVQSGHKSLPSTFAACRTACLNITPSQHHPSLSKDQLPQSQPHANLAGRPSVVLDSLTGAPSSDYSCPSCDVPDAARFGERRALFATLRLEHELVSLIAASGKRSGVLASRALFPPTCFESIWDASAEHNDAERLRFFTSTELLRSHASARLYMAWILARSRTSTI